MTLRLAIENLDRLPDGGPVRVEVKARGLDIGRDSHLDWTLPDPSRYVSSKHCEIRYRDNEYWLTDVSTNGTFVNGAQFRLDAPYRLRDGDRLSIGPYIVAVAIEGAERAAPAPAAYAQAASDVWGAVGDSAPPEGRDAYRVRNRPQTPGDFLDFATDAGMAPSNAASLRAAAPTRDDLASAWNDAPAAALSEAPAAAWSEAPAAAWNDAPAPAWGEPAAAPAAAEAWLSGPFPPKPAPPPPDPRELPRVELPRPTRPAEPAPPEPVAAPPLTQPSVAVPPPAAPPPLREAAPPPSAAAGVALIERICAAAGIPKAALAGRDPGELADEIGAVLRLTADNLVQIAASRRQTKSAIRSAHHTMYKPTENNPLKFAADANHAMEIMFGPPSRVHLKAPAAVAEVFGEAKAHNVLTFGAMQGALDALFEDLSPDKIEASLGTDRGLGAMMASRKARLWDAFAERWRALTKRADGRLNDAFMALFAQAYDRLDDKGGR